MSRLIERKRASIAAVTDGKQVDGDSVVEAIVRELREGEPFKRLRSVA
jgi:predicted CopG family antitoxin